MSRKGRTDWEFVGDEKFHRLIKPKLDAGLAGFSDRLEGWFDYPDIGWRFMDIVYEPVRDGDDTVVGVAVSIRDTTLRRQAKDAAPKSALGRISGLSTAGIFRTDRHGQVTFVSDRWSRIMGLAGGLCAAKAWSSAIHPKDREAALDVWKNCVASGAPYADEFRIILPDGLVAWTCSEAAPERDQSGEIIGYVGKILDVTAQKSADAELQLMRKDGETIWVNLSVTDRKDATGKTVEWRSTVVDITQRRIAEEELRESEGRLNTVAGLSPVALVHTDRDGLVTFVNAAFLRIYGREREKMLRDGWSDAIHPEDAAQVEESWRQSVKAGKENRAEFRIIQPDGKVVWVYGQTVPVRDAGGDITGYIGTLTDITPQKTSGDWINWDTTTLN